MSSVETAFEYAPDALVVTDAEGRLTATNLAYRRLVGAPVDETRFWPTRTSEQRAARNAFLAELLLRGNAKADAELPGADGGVIAVRLRGAKADARFVVSIHSSSAAATERTWSDALRQAHDRLERAVGGSRDGLWDWDIVHDRVYFSPRWYEMLGYANLEFAPSIEIWVELLHPDDRAGTNERVRRALEDPTFEYENEFRMRHKDGSWRWILARAAVARDESGRALIMSGSHADITARRDAEAAEQRQRAFVERVIDSIPNLVFVKDVRNNFVLVNEAVAKIFNAPKEAIVKKNNAEVHANADDLALYESIEAVVLRDRTTVVAEETFAGGDGVERRYITTKMPIEGENGELLVLGTSVDVTEQKRIEAELRSAKEAAEAATVAKSQFLATMSHEIRTPLNGVIGATDLLLISNLTPKQQELAEVARTSADALLGIVDDVLDFSRIEEGRLEIEHVPMRVDAVVGEVIELMAGQAEKKGIELSSALGSKLSRPVLGDPLRVRQVLLNLVSNATKFSHDGEIVVRAKVTGSSDEVTRVRFEVADNGIGIPADVIPKLFQAFTQADGSTTRKYGGSGLGLAICKRLVEMMGGTIGVFSTAGSGSTFWFVLPFRHADAESIAPPPDPASPSRSPGAKLRVLVAEDNPVNQMVIARMLESLGYAADLVADGTETIIAAFQARYSCILLDCQMPGLDGYAVARAIRAREAPDSRVPILAVTANAIGGERERCLDAGMDDFLAKPVELAQLRQALERHLR